MSENNWLSGEPFVISPRRSGYHLYKDWLQRHGFKQASKVDTRCHYYQVVIQQWFLRQNIFWKVKPWMVALVSLIMALLAVDRLYQPYLASPISLQIGAFLLGMSFMVGLTLTLVWLEDRFPAQAYRMRRRLHQLDHASRPIRLGLSTWLRQPLYTGATLSGK